MFISDWQVSTDGHEWVENARGEWWLTDGLPHHVPQHKTYAPLQDHTGLFRTFADTVPTPDGIRAFANRYGLLGLRQSHHRVGGSAPWHEPGGASQEDWVTWGESQEDWVKAILTMRHTVALWELAHTQQRTALAQQLFWDDRAQGWMLDTHPAFSADEQQPDGSYRFPARGHVYLRPLRQSWLPHHVHYASNALPQLHVCHRLYHPVGWLSSSRDVLAAALGYVQEVLTLHLQESPRLSMAWDRDVAHAPRLCVSVGTLLSALWIQFAQAVTGEKNYKQCGACRAWFEVSPQTARTDKAYCNSTCRTWAYRERHPHPLQQSGTGKRGPAASRMGE
jgi:hypothetical protein